MQDLLIHSTAELAGIILPALEIAAVREIAEIGVEGGEMTALLFPYHQNPLLERLERNRLQCYLSVIQWQDQAHARQAA